MSNHRRSFSTLALAGALICAYSATVAQGFRSPEVHPDRKVTFRFRAPNAKEVFLAREGAQRLKMSPDDRGVWTVTTEPLEPDYYGYSIVADGVGYIDPANPLMKPNLLNTQSMVRVPGPGTLPWELNDVPRGQLHRHFHKSTIVGDQRDYYVYAPPGYDPRAGKSYPVLYLLHGFSDDAGGWTAVGRAHVIMDNLIAQGKAKPMLVVMPLGYGAPEIVAPGGPGLRDQSVWQRNVTRFRDYVLTELIPLVEKGYRVSRDRKSRAIAGLSMGGTESLVTGLNAIDKFDYVGAFSSGGLSQNYAAEFPNLDSKVNGKIKLLWIACGTEDFVLNTSRGFTAWLKTKGVDHTYKETSGGHTWMVWRRYLAEFVPMLFK